MWHYPFCSDKDRLNCCNLTGAGAVHNLNLIQLIPFIM